MATYPVKLLIDKNGTAFIPVVNSDSIITPDGDTLDDLLDEKQDTLVSGTNLKTINNQSLLGSGNIDVSGGGGTPTDVRINGTSITSSGTANIVTEGTYNASTNKIATINDVVSYKTITSNFNAWDLNAGAYLIKPTTSITMSYYKWNASTSSQELTTESFTEGGTILVHKHEKVPLLFSSGDYTEIILDIVSGGYGTGIMHWYAAQYIDNNNSPIGGNASSLYGSWNSFLFWNNKELIDKDSTQALTNKTYNGYTLAAACTKGVVTSIDTSTNLPTSNAVKTYVDNIVGDIESLLGGI